MIKSISNIPIFKVGIHNGRKFTADDIKEMVENFYTLKKENPDFQIPIKVGHDDLIGSEKPAIGWMDNLRIDGEFIVCDFHDISYDAYEALRQKKYKNRSIEIIPEFINSLGEKLGRVICGIAVLGSSLPAVNLPDIRFQNYAAALRFDKDGIKPEIIPLTDDGLDFSKTVLNVEIATTMELGEAAKLTLANAAESVPEKEPEKIEPKKNSNKTEEEFTVDKTATITKEDKANVATASDASHASQNHQATSGQTDGEKSVSKEELAKKFSLLESFKNPDEIVSKLMELEKEKEEKQRLIKEREDEKSLAFKQGIESFTRDLIKENKLLPKHRAIVNHLMVNLDPTKEFEFEVEFGKKEKRNLVELFKFFLNELPQYGLLSSFAQMHAQAATAKDAFEMFLRNKGISEADYKKCSIADHKKLAIEFKALQKELGFGD